MHIPWVQEQRRNCSGGKSYLNLGHPRGRGGGTGILLVNKSIRVKAVPKDNTGIILCLDLNHEGGKFQVMTVCGIFRYPAGYPAFITKTMILCGDFNMVKNPRLDRQPPVDQSNYTEGNVNLGTMSKVLSEIIRKYTKYI